MEHMNWCPWARLTHKADKHKQHNEAYPCRWDAPLIALWLIRSVKKKGRRREARQARRVDEVDEDRHVTMFDPAQNGGGPAAPLPYPWHT